MKTTTIKLEDTRRPIAEVSNRDIVFGHCGLENAKWFTPHPCGGFTYTIMTFKAEKIGPSKFWKVMSKSSVTLKDNKLWGDIELLTQFINEPFIRKKYEWLTNNPSLMLYLLRNNKVLWKLVLQGKITSQKGLINKFNNLYFKGIFNPKDIKRLMEGMGSGHGISLWDLYHHTTSPCEALHKWTHGGVEDTPLWRDTLQYAKAQDAKINFSWSLLRMREEHNKQILRDQQGEIENKSDEEIYPPLNFEGISLINNERDAFKEALMQSNCLYRCYWNDIKRGDYVAFTTNRANGDKVTIGYYYSNSRGFRFDQAHTRFNGSISPSEQSEITEVIKSHSQEILERVSKINKNIKRTPLDEDIPF